MTDRELLELAAKAARYAQSVGDKLNFYIREYDVVRYWNPLLDDGDALGLAVKLGLTLSVDISPCAETKAWGYNGNRVAAIEQHGQDPYAATRRAIVRAAAEIGRNMP